MLNSFKTYSYFSMRKEKKFQSIFSKLLGSSLVWLAVHIWNGTDEQTGTIPWSRKWQLVPVFLSGKFHGQRSLADDNLWGHKESNTAEWQHTDEQTWVLGSFFFCLWKETVQLTSPSFDNLPSNLLITQLFIVSKKMETWSKNVGKNWEDWLKNYKVSTL